MPSQGTAALLWAVALWAGTEAVPAAVPSNRTPPPPPPRGVAPHPSDRCPEPPLERAGRWRPLARSALFGVPMPLWYVPADPRCGYRLVTPAQACRCLRKVAFIGDSLTRGFARAFTEYVTQNGTAKPSTSRHNKSGNASRLGCPPAGVGPEPFSTSGPLPPSLRDPCHTVCPTAVEYTKITQYTSGRGGVERDVKRFLANLAGATPAGAVDVVVLNFGLHHMVAWADKVLANYPERVRRALELALDAAPAAAVVWLSITAQHVKKKPKEWRRLQANPRVKLFNDAAFRAIRQLQRSGGKFQRVTVWDLMPMTSPPEAEAMSKDGVHYAEHMHTMRSLILLSHLFAPSQRCHERP
eukprot:EG_transcript_14463